MAMIDLKAIEERCEKATPGPWPLNLESEKRSDGGIALISARIDGLDRSFYESHWDIDEGNSENDAEFVSYARTDLPALIAWARRARTELLRIRLGAINDGYHIDRLLEELRDE